MRIFLPASLALALGAPMGASADTRSDIQDLRQEIDAIRAAYEARLRALEERLKAAEGASSNTSNAAPAHPASPAAPAGVPGPSASPSAGSAGGANAFNPSMSLILSGLYTRTSQDPARNAISGFQLPAGSEAGPGTRGFSLAESELGFAANIDPWLRGAANIALLPDDSVSVEEAYIQTTSLGNGFALKAGRFFSGVGYLNAQHAHTWDFVDNPLAYQALLGTQYGDDGVQLTWLAPTDQFIEIGAELGRGRSFPGGDNSRNGAGMTALMAHTGGDFGTSQSWRAGLSVLNAKADNQALQGLNASGSAVTNAFSGQTRVWVADAIWKWAPNGNATRTSFKLQGEYLRSTRSGSLVYDVGNTDSTAAMRAVQSGWYVQGVYQFMPRWRVGLRTEALDPGTPDYGLNAPFFGASGYRPRKNSLMVDFNASEFSRVRLQLARDRSREGLGDNQLLLQYQMSLGAHGAHSY
jgi:Phosphate-selective porin O and P